MAPMEQNDAKNTFSLLRFIVLTLERQGGVTANIKPARCVDFMGTCALMRDAVVLLLS